MKKNNTTSGFGLLLAALSLERSGSALGFRPFPFIAVADFCNSLYQDTTASRQNIDIHFRAAA
jgi:hypothetical protein